MMVDILQVESSKAIINVLNDSRIVIQHPMTTTMDAMMGTGGLVAENQIERGIAKHLIGSDNAAAAAVKADYVAFLAPLIGTPREVAVRGFVEGIARGGLTEEQALAVMDAFTRPDDCFTCHTIDVNTLPTDRYFRDAWEWED